MCNNIVNNLIHLHNLDTNTLTFLQTLQIFPIFYFVADHQDI